MTTAPFTFSHWKIGTLTMVWVLLAAGSVAALGQTSTPAPAPTTSQVSKTTKESSNSTSVEIVKGGAAENRTPVSPEELRAFIIVGVAFAVAWLLVTALREVTRWKEFKARKEERLIVASTEHTKALKDLVRILQPDGESPKSEAALVARLLELTADYIKSQTKVRLR